MFDKGPPQAPSALFTLKDEGCQSKVGVRILHVGPVCHHNQRVVRNQFHQSGNVTSDGEILPHPSIPPPFDNAPEIRGDRRSWGCHGK